MALVVQSWREFPSSVWRTTGYCAGASSAAYKPVDTPALEPGIAPVNTTTALSASSMIGTEMFALRREFRSSVDLHFFSSEAVRVEVERSASMAFLTMALMRSHSEIA